MLRQSFPRVLGALVFTIFLHSALTANADWPRFRGPNGSGVSQEKASTPVTWSAKKNLAWKVKLPGKGVSSPIVVGDRVFVTCYSGYGMDRNNPGNMEDLKRHLVCLDRKTGKINWTKTIDAVLPEDRYSGLGVPQHGYASHTPVSDGKQVYVFFGKTGALGFDMKGNQLWQTGVGTESDIRTWGSSSSPILYKNILIVTASAESQALVGLDTKSGKEVWRQEATGFENVWGTPAIAKVDENRDDLVIGVPNEFWGFNPLTGKLVWYCDALRTDQFNSSVIVQDGIVFGMSGRDGGTIAVRAGGKDDVSKSHVVWTGRDSGRFGTPVVYDGHFYAIGDNKTVVCVNAKTGDPVYQARLQQPETRAPAGGQGTGRSRFGGRGGMGGGDYSSPVIADGKIYFVSRSGDMYVLKVGNSFEQLAVNRVTGDREDFSGTPAISHGQLFIRSDKYLYCVASKAGIQ